MNARPPIWRGSIAACSRLDPSPIFSSPTAIQPRPSSLRLLAILLISTSFSLETGLLPVPVPPVKAFVAPRNMLLLMLSR